MPVITNIEDLRVLAQRRVPRMLAISQWQLGRHGDARATVAELMKVEPNLRVSEWLARSPSGAYPIGQLCAQALRSAGVPN